MSADIEDLLRQALRERADGIVPNQPPWEELQTLPEVRTPARRPRLWLFAAAATLALALPFLITRYVTRISHVAVVGGQRVTGQVAGLGSPVAGPPDAPLPAGFAPASVTRISLKSGWVLGTSPCGAGRCTTLARTRDGGATWHSVPVPPSTIAAGASGVSRVRFADASNGWLFGTRLWSTHDGGSTWTLVGDAGQVTSLEAAAGLVWGLGLGADGVTTVIEAPVGTDDWTSAGPAAVAGPVGISLHGKVGYTVTVSGTVLALGTSGVDERGSPCNVGSLSAVSAASDVDVAAICSADPGAGSSTKTLLLSHNGGRTWTTAGTAPRGGQTVGLAAASTHTFVLGAAGGASSLYRTSDSGATWTTVLDDTGGGAPFTDLGFTDATHGVAILATTDRPALLVSSDAGATWTPQPFSP